jgi:hypothetical protein
VIVKQFRRGRKKKIKMSEELLEFYRNKFKEEDYIEKAIHEIAESIAEHSYKIY